jgi:hypothetical protein
MDHQYQNTTIYVRDPAAGKWDATVADPDPTRPAAGAIGEYKDVVFRHLDDLRAFPNGQQFFTTLTNLGKRQVVAYVGTNVTNDNSCSGSGAGKKKIVSKMGQGWGAETRAELDHALNQWSLLNAGQDPVRWLAGRLLQTPLYRWDPAQNVATSPLNPRNVAPGHASWNGMVDVLANQLAAYRSGRASLEKRGAEGEVFDLMVWVLRDRLQDGAGSNCMVRYTPLKVQVGAGQRPAQIALFHELVHAYYEAQGRNMSAEDSQNEWNGRYYEIAAVGLPPFDNAPCSENVARGWMGVAARAQY